MAKRYRKGGLTQNVKPIKDEDYTFRIIAIKNPLHPPIKADLSTKVRIIGKYTSLNEAKKVIDRLGNVNVDYYLENINSNRVLYSKIGNPPNGKL